MMGYRTTSALIEMGSTTAFMDDFCRENSKNYSKGGLKGGWSRLFVLPSVDPNYVEGNQYPPLIAIV